ncbi:MAG: tetratricopeptide repeat protein, partial [Bacteroidales bacterium]|nr:tetratricopeptide repeat protein [Bacteroidales bacterium]
YFTYLEKAFLCEDESLGYEYKLDILNKLLEAAKKDDYVRAQLKYLVSIFERQYPGEIAVCAIKADIAMIDNDLKSVQKNLIELVASEKSSYEVWQHLMSLDYHLQDFDNLYAHSKEVVELFPNILEAYQYFTVAAYLKSSFVEVVESVETAFLLAIDDQQVMVDLLSMQGDAYHALHKYEQSDSVYDYVLYKDAEYISVLNSYSYSLSERGERLDYALELSSRLIKLASDNPSYIDTHAWALYKNGKYGEALEYINKAISIMGDYSVFYDHRGDILYSLKRVDEAVGDWQKALELDPENESLPLKIKNKTIGN